MAGALKDKVAVVTGASRGIGRAIARLFAQEGASVFLTARTEAELVSAAAEINAGSGASWTSSPAPPTGS